MFVRTEDLPEVFDAETTGYELERGVADDGQIFVVMQSAFVAVWRSSKITGNLISGAAVCERRRSGMSVVVPVSERRRRQL